MTQNRFIMKKNILLFTTLLLTALPVNAGKSDQIKEQPKKTVASYLTDGKGACLTGCGSCTVTYCVPPKATIPLTAMGTSFPVPNVFCGLGIICCALGFYQCCSDERKPRKVRGNK
jgi:hypothetical protein